MDKETGKAARSASGRKITESVEFVAEGKDGTAEVEFVFDGSNLAGKTLVAFENYIMVINYMQYIQIWKMKIRQSMCRQQGQRLLTKYRDTSCICR